MSMRWVESDPPAYTDGILKQDYAVAMELLREDPTQAQMQFCDETRTTLIHAAAYDGVFELVQLLIRHGADVNAQESCGRAPLHHAANHGHLDVIEALARAGADVNAEDKQGMSPLDWGRISRSGRKQEVVALLLKLGANES